MRLNLGRSIRQNRYPASTYPGAGIRDVQVVAAGCRLELFRGLGNKVTKGGSLSLEATVGTGPV